MDKKLQELVDQIRISTGEEWSKLMKKYLQTKHWKEWRLKFLFMAGCRCELCLRKIAISKQTGEHIFNVHHKHYDTLGCETKEDVMILHPSCHYRGHNK